MLLVSGKGWHNLHEHKDKPKQLFFYWPLCIWALIIFLHTAKTRISPHPPYSRCCFKKKHPRYMFWSNGIPYRHRTGIVPTPYRRRARHRTGAVPTPYRRRTRHRTDAVPTYGPTPCPISYRDRTRRTLRGPLFSSYFRREVFDNPGSIRIYLTHATLIPLLSLKGVQASRERFPTGEDRSGWETIRLHGAQAHRGSIPPCKPAAGGKHLTPEVLKATEKTFHLVKFSRPTRKTQSGWY